MVTTMGAPEAFFGGWSGGAEAPGKTQCAHQAAIRQSVIRQSAIRTACRSDDESGDQSLPGGGHWFRGAECARDADHCSKGGRPMWR
eukprot:327420-Alexandrium_andersonii.AAC.1